MATNFIGLIGVALLIAVPLTEAAAAPSFQAVQMTESQAKEPTR
jgi:hypothetical protein